MRFIAPPHVTRADLVNGPVLVEDGVLEVPDDIGHGDITGLLANGFTLAPAEAAPIKSKPKAIETVAG